MSHHKKMKKIPLTRGLCLKIDAEDYEKVSKKNWHLNAASKGDGSQATLRVFSESEGERVEFGQYLTGIDPKTHFIAFKNHDRLDFRKENIKKIPIEYLNYHKLAKHNNSSKYKGVFYLKNEKKYQARIKYNGEIIIIGHSRDEDEAGRMYNEKTRELFGEYAFQNIIGQDNRKKDVALDDQKMSRNMKTSKKDYRQRYRGVKKIPSGRYEAKVQRKFIGTFKTMEDAAYAYNEEAKKIYGEKAILNPLPEGFVGEKRIEKEKILLFGKDYDSIHQIGKIYGISPQTIKKRMEFMTIEEAVSVPKGTRVYNPKNK